MVRPSTFVPLFLKLPKEHIVRLKFTLEGYEGLGVLRTTNAKRGEVVILALTDTISGVNEVVQSLQEELEIREIPPPEDLKEDWLLGEE